MSLVLTSTVHHEKAAMVHSPMQVDNPADHSGSSSAPETPEPGEGSTTGALTERNTPDDSGSKPKKNLSVSVERTPEGDDKDDHLCVCAPEQKIPRPPNSFILYRSHQHPRVASENPGLSNPQISQIIGDNWRKESPEVKEKWKGMANEESKRHNLRYPGYRYQPRRRSKALAAKSDDDLGRCPRCGGRYTATPRSSGQPPTPSKLKTQVPAAESPTVRLHEQQQSRLSEREAASAGEAEKKRVPRRGGEEPKTESPEAKRRRLVDFPPTKQLLPSVNAPGGFLAGSPHGQLYPQASPGVATFSPSTPRTGGSYSQGSDFLSNWQTMPPPPRPILPGPLGGPTHRHGATREEIDESLRLPPLQTAFSTATSSPARETDARTTITPIMAGLGTLSAREGTGESTQEQIMSIAFARKLAMLSKICPPLSKASGGAAGRGAIIALEGPKLDVLAQVGRTVERALQVSTQVDLKSWTNDYARDVLISGNDHGEVAMTSELKDEGPAIFKIIIDWHEKSKEMAQHVQAQHIKREAGEAVSSAKTPVALIKDGFSLTVSDAFACATNPSATYGAAQHWEWMASLWRDIIGPDLVVYVKPSTEDEINKLGTVDFQRRMGSIVVRVGIDKSLDEATERRIAFEVIEWMRDGWIQEVTPQG